MLRTAGFEVANVGLNQPFSNTKDWDLAMFTTQSNQAIQIGCGVDSSKVSTLTISNSNAVFSKDVSVSGVVDATTLKQGGVGVVLTTGGTISGAVTVNNTLTATTLQQGSVGVVLTTASNQTVTGALTVNGTLSANTYQQGGVALAIVPVGAVMPFAGSTAPNGWFVCNGQQVSRTTYAALFLAITTTYGNGDGSTTFTLPDMRGRVVLATNSTYLLGNTGGAASQTLAAANLPPHTHSGTTGTNGSHNHSGSANSDGLHNHTITDPGHTHYWGYNSSTVGYAWTTWGGSSGWTENRTTTSSRSTTGITGTNSGGSHTHTLSINNNGDHTHSFTTDNGPGTTSAINVMNPYIAMNYIIKW